MGRKAGTPNKSKTGAAIDALRAYGKPENSDRYVPKQYRQANLCKDCLCSFCTECGCCGCIGKDCLCEE